MALFKKKKKRPHPSSVIFTADPIQVLAFSSTSKYLSWAQSKYCTACMHKSNYLHLHGVIQLPNAAA